MACGIAQCSISTGDTDSSDEMSLARIENDPFGKMTVAHVYRVLFRVGQIDRKYLGIETMLKQLSTVPRWGIYAGLSAVFVLSVLMMKSVNDSLQIFASLPAVGALFAALLQIFRDEASHEKALLQITAQNSFSLGATSHMANVAFDKHSEFCESYISEMYTTLNTLTRDLVTKEALEHAGSLAKIRREFAVWLNKELEEKLKHFERAIREIGAGGATERSSDIIQDTGKHELLVSKVLAIIGEDEYRGEPLDKDLAIATIIQKLREVLGTEELAKVRGILVERTLSNIDN